MCRFLSLTGKIAALALATGLMALAAPRANAQLVIGTNVAGNEYPFSSSYNGHEYEQIFSSSAFSGPVIISQIAFASFNGSVGVFNFTSTLALGTTSATPTSQAATYAVNKRADLTTVFTGTQSATLLGTNTFDLIFNVTPFVYDPALGNFLLDVVTTTVTPTQGAGPYFDAGGFLTNNEPLMGRVFNDVQGTGAVQAESNNGLVTRFGITGVATAPEPGSLALLILAGFPLAGLVRPRFRTARRHQS